MSKAGALNLASGLGGKIDKKEVISAVDQYEKYHVHYGGEQEVRKANYTDMVNKYYDLATSFYEYGWGESFHFADRWKGESLRESIKRHEHFLALQLSLKPGMKVLDVGCGIGGPLREIARFRDTNWSDPGPNLGGSRAPIRIQHRTCCIWIRMSWIPYAWMRIRISPRSKNRLHTLPTLFLTGDFRDFGY